MSIGARIGGQGYEVRARARGRAGEIWRGRAERIAARYRNGEEGRLSQRWLRQKLWKFQVGPRPRSPQPPAGWLGDEERRCEEQPNPVGCRTADPYQPDHPTSLLPDHHHCHPPRMAHSKIKFYLKKPLLDPKHQIMQFDLGQNHRRSNIPSVAERVFLCKFVRVGNSEIVGRAT